MHYVNLTSVGEDNHAILQMLLKAVHGFNASRATGDRIAVAFPAMLDAIIDERGKVLQMPRCGAQMRLFGERALLEAFLQSAGPTRAARLGMTIRGVVAEVPPNAGAARYVRDRRFERGHPKGAYARRQKLRAERQGREYQPRQRGDAPQTFSFGLESQSSGRSFHLDVRRELTAQAVSLSNITAYGLCGDGAAVPMF